MKFLSVLFLILFATLYGKAQVVEIEYSNPGSINTTNLAKQIPSDADSLELIRALNNQVNSLRSEGHLLANLDFVKNSGNTFHAVVNIGPIYQLESLQLLGLPEELERNLYKKPGKLSGQSFSDQDIGKLFTEVVEFSENNGFPFASIRLDSVSVTGDMLSAILIYSPGPYITFDSMEITGNGNVKRAFLESHLRIVQGRPFNQRSIDQIQSRIDNLPYLQLKEFTGISFQNEEARVLLELENVAANRFDAVIGFLPNEREGNELLITGQVDLELNNLFRSGKRFSLYWDKIQVETQTLNVNYYHPNLFRSAVGIMADFHLYKQDTSFINRFIKLSANFETTKNHQITAFSHWESSRLLSTVQFDTVTALPDIADFNINYLGLGFNSFPAHRFFIPENGWGLEFSGAFGSKQIVKNSGLDDSLYDGIDLSTTQFITSVKIAGQQQVKNSIFLYARMAGGYMANERLFLNDLFRLGGLNTLRGFNENFFYASEYATGTVELRSYFNGQSSFFVFYDQGFIQYDLENSNYSDSPFGLGGGINLETKGGIFNFVYALGKSIDQSFGFQTSKIHFGYIATF